MLIFSLRFSHSQICRFSPAVCTIVSRSRSVACARSYRLAMCWVRCVKQTLQRLYELATSLCSNVNRRASASKCGHAKTSLTGSSSDEYSATFCMDFYIWYYCSEAATFQREGCGCVDYIAPIGCYSANAVRCKGWDFPIGKYRKLNSDSDGQELQVFWWADRSAKILCNNYYCCHDWLVNNLATRAYWTM